jgi:siroheme synthase-like protein
MSATDKFMPISISLKDRRCLVVGGGFAAVRKVESLLEYGAAITVIATNADEKLEYHAKRGRIALEAREYRSPEAADFGLVVSASDDAEVDQQVHADATEAGALITVVNDLAHCDFLFPEVLRRDCLTAAISTDGRAPFVSGHLRLVLDNIFPAHWSRLMKLAASFRADVQKRWADNFEKKNVCYSEFLEADWKRMLEELSDEQIEKELKRMLDMPE